MQSEFLQDIQERGFFSDCTDLDGLDATLHSTKPCVAYIGFDCTAPSLHVGSLIQIMILRRFQLAGHKPIVLLGGGTTKIGDPSGKDSARQLLTDEKILENKQSIKSVFEHFIAFEDQFDATTNKAVLVDNARWLNNINYIDFLREYGRFFSVNRMLSMDSVKLRLDREHHLSFLEFNYMILQAYDFEKLYRDYQCVLQIGGSDQWGNIVNGLELHRKVQAESGEEHEDIFGLTTPLLTTASGGKMGKTEQGAIWLNTELLSAYDYWQFWRNTEDADVGRFLRLFTDLPIEAIEKLEVLEGAEINDAKIRLANEATAMLHGEKAAKEAEATAQKVFAEGSISDNLPTVEIAKSELDAGIPAFALFKDAGLEPSGGAARRLIKGGGAKLNDEKISAEEQLITSNDLNGDGVIKLSAGKKRHVLVRTS